MYVLLIICFILLPKLTGRSCVIFWMIYDKHLVGVGLFFNKKKGKWNKYIKPRNLGGLNFK